MRDRIRPKHAKTENLEFCESEKKPAVKFQVMRLAADNLRVVSGRNRHQSSFGNVSCWAGLCPGCVKIENIIAKPCHVRRSICQMT